LNSILLLITGLLAAFQQLIGLGYFEDGELISNDGFNFACFQQLEK